MNVRVNRGLSVLAVVSACLVGWVVPAWTAPGSALPDDVAAAYDVAVRGGARSQDAQPVFEADNPANNLSLRFSGAGLRGRPRNGDGRLWLFDVAPKEIAYGDSIHTLRVSGVTAAGNHVDYELGGISLRYTNGVESLQQSFTLPAPEKGGTVPGRTTITIDLAVDGDFTLRLDSYFVDLIAPDGKATLRYGATRATDADGMVLNSGITVRSGAAGRPEGVRFVVHAVDAKYPITVWSTIRLPGAQFKRQVDSTTGPNIAQLPPAARPFGGTPAVNGVTSGGAMTGKPFGPVTGVTESVLQLMQREADNPPVVRTDPEGRKEFDAELVKSDNPDAPAVSQWPAAAGLEQQPPVTSSPTVGTTFQTVTLTGLTESASVPPDPMGDVGPTQILAATNGRIKVFDKNGVLGPLNVSDNTFWASQSPLGVSDPHIRYDRLSDRWFVLAADLARFGNKILLAVSNGPTITGQGSFTFFSFTTSVMAGDAANFCDSPSLGVDANAIYGGCNMFSIAGLYQHSSAYVIRKSTLLSGTLNVTGFGNITGGTAAGPFAPRGVDNDDPTWTEGYIIGIDSASLSTLQIRRVLNPASATPTLSGNLTLTVPTNTNMARQSAPGIGASNNNRIDVSDERLFMASIHKNKLTGVTSLWTAQEVEVSSTGAALNTTTTDDAKRIGARWFEIGNLDTTPTVTQSGTLFDTTPGTSSYNTMRGYLFPTVAETGQGHMALGASFGSSISATAETMGAAVSGRLRTDPAGSTQAPVVAVPGGGNYRLCDGGNGACPRNRWGAYSFTDVDPNDDQTVWTFQEVAVAPSVYTIGFGNWAVRAIKLVAPPPATPVSAAPNFVCTGIANTCVTLTGTSSDGSEFFDPGVDPVAYANHIAATVTGGVAVNPWPTTTIVIPGSPATTPVTQLNLCVDTTGATPGTQDVTVTNPDGQTSSGTGILSVNPTPAAPSASNGGPICAGGTLQLFASTVDGATYTWTGPGFSSSEQNPSIAGATTAAAGTYSVTVTVDGCVSGSATTEATVIATGAACGDPTETTCNAPDTCGDEGVCQSNFAAPGTACGVAGSQCKVQDACDGSGSCIDNGFESVATLCTGASQGGGCDDDAADHCTGADDSCVDVFRASGFICRGAVDACDAAETCTGTSAACPAEGFQAAGTACGDGSSGSCDNADTCNGEGSCQVNHVADGTSCGDTGTQCTNQDSCFGGVCHDNGFQPAGTACGNPSSGACDNADTCNGEGSCQVNHVADGMSCGDTGTQCTNQDTCLGGVCHDNGFLPAGAACGDASSGPCDNADRCNGAGVCQENHIADGTACGDGGSQCTNQDTCLNGACHDNGYKPTGTACSDGNACTVGDTCGGGTCQGGTAVVCTASDQCHNAGVCNTASGICSNPTKPDGTACDDGSLCTTSDVCTGGVCGGHGHLNEGHPRSVGYWKALCEHNHSGDHLTDQDAQCVGDSTASFDTHTVADICAILTHHNGGDCDDDDDITWGDWWHPSTCDKARAELLAFALNRCRGRVCDGQQIDSHCDPSMLTVGQSFTQADNLIAGNTPSNNACRDSRCLAREINNGRALELDDVHCDRDDHHHHGGMRCHWSAPHHDGDTLSTIHYEIWRREHGAAEFTKVATVNTTEYYVEDPDIDYEYDVVPAD